jgi:protein-S-isoprenylcysteine O-methyltransferase Ste14
MAINDPQSVRGGRGQAEKRVARQSAVRVVITLLLFAAITFLPFADRRAIGVLETHHTARRAGLVLVSAGWGLVIASGIAPGRLYSGDVTLQEDHHLVTSGPYRYIRHPRYLGALMLSFGLPLLFRSWIGLIGGLAFIGVILFRIRDEETFMQREFGEQWEAYRERSWHLIPFVY